MNGQDAALDVSKLERRWHGRRGKLLTNVLKFGAHHKQTERYDCLDMLVM